MRTETGTAIRSSRSRPTFARDRDGFRAELTRRVDAHFSERGTSRFGGWRMYRKTAIMLGWMAAAYYLLVFVAASWWFGLLCVAALAFAIAGIGFSVQHDANHGAYSSRAGVNRVLERTLDLLGASSYLWRWKHNVFHHTYTNVVGHDNDISLAPFARMTTADKLRPIHRFQHIYMWPLYGFIVFHMHFVEDFHNLWTGRVGQHSFPRPKGMRLFEVFLSKLTVIGWAVVVPLLFHSWWVVLVFYAILWFTVGLVLGLVFQVAHCLDDAEFPAPDSQTGTIENTWAIHQVVTTVDFAPDNRALTWFVGGLNFQIEHHLFPKVCHIHYPMIAPIVREVCAEFDVPYRSNRSFVGALASHGRLLRALGRPQQQADKAAAATAPIAI